MGLMSSTENLLNWRVFNEVVNRGGIIAASEALDCEPSTVSRIIKKLEKDLGAPLFLRATRPLELTDLGRLAFDRSRELLNHYGDMMSEIRGDREKLAGVIRLAAHAGIGPIEITPALVEFQTVYPEIELELHQLTAGIPEAFHNNGRTIDVVVGYGPEGPIPGVVSRYVGAMPFIPCASPLYLQRHGTPMHPNELCRHTGILIDTPSRVSTETLQKGEEIVTLHWNNTLRFNSLVSAKSAAMLGAGIVPDMPLYHATEAFQNRRLIPILPGWRRKHASCFVCATEGAWTKHRIRVFVEWLAERERQTLSRLRSEHAEFYV